MPLQGCSGHALIYLLCIFLVWHMYTFPIIHWPFSFSPAHKHNIQVYFLHLHLPLMDMEGCLCWHLTCAHMISPWYRGPWQPPSIRLLRRILAVLQTTGASAVQQLAWQYWETPRQKCLSEEIILHWFYSRRCRGYEHSYICKHTRQEMASFWKMTAFW